MNNQVKNIGIFSYDFFPSIGGQGRHLYEIYKRISHNQKYRIFVFSPSNNKFEKHIQIFKRTQNYFFGNILFSILLNFRINKIIKKYKIDLVHLHGGPGGIFLFTRLKIPVIYTAHHTYYQQYKYIKSEFWKIIFKPFENYGYHLSKKIICVSKSTKNILIQYYNIESNKISVIPNGIDKNKFFNTNKGKINNTIFFVGRLDKRKGIDFLIKTIPVVKTKINNIKLYIAGTGKYYLKLNKFVLNNNLSKNVFFLGKISDKELLDWYNKVQIIIIPSVFEGFGITAIESMACGTPIISTNTDGLSDLIINNSNGILVEYNNVDNLSEKIINLLQNPPLRNKLSNNGIKFSKQFYWQEIAKKTFNFYGEAFE